MSKSEKEIFVEKSKIGNVVVYRGKTYASIRSLALAVSLPYGALVNYIRRYKNVETAVERLREVVTPQVIEVWGKKFNSVSELAEYYGIGSYVIKPDILKDRERLEKTIIRAYSSKIEYRGRSYPNLTTLCAHEGVLTQTVYSRLKLGWSLDEAVTVPVIRAKTASFMYRGEHFTSRRDLYEKYGINSSLLHSQGKMNPELSFETLFDIVNTFLETCGGNRPTLVSKIPFVIYNGEWYSNILDFCKACNVTSLDYYSAQNRLIRTERLTPNPFEVMKYVRTRTETLLYYQGKHYKPTKLASLLKSNRQTLVKKGIAREEIQLITPNCTFNPTGYCKDTFHDYQKHKEAYLSRKNGQVK